MMYRRNRINNHAEYYIWWAFTLALSIKVYSQCSLFIGPSMEKELQLLLEGCKHIRGIICFGYPTEGATCKMLMLLLKSQVESAFNKLDIRYIRYNLQCVIILMCIYSCVLLYMLPTWDIFPLLAFLIIWNGFWVDYFKVSFQKKILVN